MDNKIKLGVSLYSFSTEYISDQLDLEGVLKKASEMGYQGIEIVAAQMVPEYPYPSDEWLAYFAGLLKKFNLQPVCWSAYIDMGIRSDRDLTREKGRIPDRPHPACHFAGDFPRDDPLLQTAGHEADH